MSASTRTYTHTHTHTQTNTYVSERKRVYVNSKCIKPAIIYLRLFFSFSLLLTRNS